MNILEEIKIRCKYRDEMVLWEYDLRRECEQALVVGYINHKVRGSDIHEVRRKLDVGFDLGKIGEIRRRVATKNKINMR